jgi:hypothetical protein
LSAGRVALVEVMIALLIFRGDSGIAVMRALAHLRARNGQRHFRPAAGSKSYLDSMKIRRSSDDGHDPAARSWAMALPSGRAP